MKEKFITLICIVIFSTTTYALDQEFAKNFGKTKDTFCNVKDWEKGLNTKKEVGLDYYKKLKIAKPVSGNFAIEKLSKKDWIIIDARDKEARRATGVLTGTILLTSDYEKKEDNDFSKTKILKELKKRKNLKVLKKSKIKELNKISDLSKINYVLFCNGYKCHRSTWGACQLRSYGVDYENIYIVLGGFSELKDLGAKIK
jgi:rhodanese-related sulfurtransferase